jgi:glycosyltransferase involved in cell wall biosynthesis
MSAGCEGGDFEAVVLIFSKDRALQLDLCLRSWRASVKEDSHAKCCRVQVLYTASSEHHEVRYRRLMRDYHEVEWVRQFHFLRDVKRIIRTCPWCMFVVDDSVFLRPVDLGLVFRTLTAHGDRAMGFSLRLGRNIQQSYTLGSEQLLPGFLPSGDPELLCWEWATAQGDFAYPLELSSSVYASALILNLLEGATLLRNPNELEQWLHEAGSILAAARPHLFSYASSACVSNPLNLVQQTAANRHARGPGLSAEDLGRRFDVGDRLDLSGWWGRQVNSVHDPLLPSWLAGVCPAIAPSSFPGEPIPLPEGPPLVSVVIPAYNYGQFLGDAIESALGQSLQPIEVLVVDGGSEDALTPEVLDAYRGHPMVRVFRREGRHLVGSNRNFGIEQAKSEWICCLDADDALDPLYLEKVWLLALSGGWDVVSSAARCFGSRSDWMGVVQDPALGGLLEENAVMTAALFRKELWRRVGGYRDFGLGADHLHEDWEFWVRCAAVGANFRNLDREALIRYRVHHSGSLSQQGGAVPDRQWQRQRIREALDSWRLSSGSTVYVSAPRQDLHLVGRRVAVVIPKGKRVLLCMGEWQAGLSEPVIEGWLDQGFLVTLLITERIGDTAPDFPSRWGQSHVECFVLAGQWDVPSHPSVLDYLLRTRTPSMCVGFQSALFDSTAAHLSAGHRDIRFLHTPEPGGGQTGGSMLSDPGFAAFELVEMRPLTSVQSGAKGREVWLLDMIDCDGKSWMHPSLALVPSPGWTLMAQAGTPRGIAWVADGSSSLSLRLPPGLQCRFLCHPYSGAVELIRGGQRKVFDLYRESWSELLVDTAWFSRNVIPFPSDS